MLNVASGEAENPKENTAERNAIKGETFKKETEAAQDNGSNNSCGKHLYNSSWPLCSILFINPELTHSFSHFFLVFFYFTFEFAFWSVMWFYLLKKRSGGEWKTSAMCNVLNRSETTPSWHQDFASPPQWTLMWKKCRTSAGRPIANVPLCCWRWELACTVSGKGKGALYSSSVLKLSAIVSRSRWDCAHKTNQ